MPESHIVVATPCYGGQVTQRYMTSVINLLYATAERGIRMSIDMLGFDSLITRSRNTMVSRFLDNPTATHLFFVDADIGFAPEQALRLLDFDRDVVAGMYPLKLIHYDDTVAHNLQRGEPLQTAQLRYVGAPLQGAERREEDGFVTGEFAGAGFLMIKREALLKLIEAHPELRYTAAHNSPQEIRGAVFSAIFECMIEPETGHYLSEDYAFCRRWRDLGGDLWLDARSQLMHVGPREFVGDAGARFFPGTR